MLIFETNNFYFEEGKFDVPKEALKFYGSNSKERSSWSLDKPVGFENLENKEP